MLKSSNKKILTTIAILSILATGIVYGIYYKNKYRQDTSGAYTVGDVQTNNDQVEKPKNEIGDSTETSNIEPQKSTNRTASPRALVAPSGNFVSAHNVKSSSIIESVCVTSPGAKCSILFIMGGVTKSLNEKTADHEGITAWTFKPSDLGIKSGSWEIKSVASLDGQTKETKDAMKLEVTP